MWKLSDTTIRKRCTKVRNGAEKLELCNPQQRQVKWQLHVWIKEMYETKKNLYYIFRELSLERCYFHWMQSVPLHVISNDVFLQSISLYLSILSVLFCASVCLGWSCTQKYVKYFVFFYIFFCISSCLYCSNNIILFISFLITYCWGLHLLIKVS